MTHAYFTRPLFNAPPHLAVSGEYKLCIPVKLKYVRDRPDQKIRPFLIDHPARKKHHGIHRPYAVLIPDGSGVYPSVVITVAYAVIDDARLPVRQIIHP